uniref:Uncharacterized protein n=1 Tax=viral metagenome TaxID=1070528 RepID=A0A6M3XKF7_9ZZZZ
MAWNSLADLRTIIRRSLRDTSTSSPKFTDAEVDDAIRQAVRGTHGMYKVREVYTSLSLTAGVFHYAIPNYVERVTEIERESTSPVSSTSDANWARLLYWGQVPGSQTNLLEFGQSHAGSALRIYYTRSLPVPPTEHTTNAAINPAAAQVPLASSQSFLVDWPPVGFLKMNHEFIGYEAVSATGFTGLTRGALGTVAASHAAGTIVSPVLGDEYTPVENFIIMKSGSLLHMVAIHDGARVDVAADVTLHRLMQEEEERIRRNSRQQPAPRSVRFDKRGF